MVMVGVLSAFPFKFLFIQTRVVRFGLHVLSKKDNK